MIDHRVAVCRDHAKDACKRQQCKYYHIPIAMPPANVMATIYNTDLCSRIDSTTLDVYNADANIATISSNILKASTFINGSSSTTKDLLVSAHAAGTTTIEASLTNERHDTFLREQHRSATQTH